MRWFEGIEEIQTDPQHVMKMRWFEGIEEI
jgi:hypothetical protein